MPPPAAGGAATVGGGGAVTARGALAEAKHAARVLAASGGLDPRAAALRSLRSSRRTARPASAAMPPPAVTPASGGGGGSTSGTPQAAVAAAEQTPVARAAAKSTAPALPPVFGAAGDSEGIEGTLAHNLRLPPSPKLPPRRAKPLEYLGRHPHHQLHHSFLSDGLVNLALEDSPRPAPGDLDVLNPRFAALKPMDGTPAAGRSPRRAPRPSHSQQTQLGGGGVAEWLQGLGFAAETPGAEELDRAARGLRSYATASACDDLAVRSACPRIWHAVLYMFKGLMRNR